MVYDKDVQVDCQGDANKSSRSSGRVTISEVARLAHVSVGTVSNVLNNPSTVAAPTRSRVLEAIDKTGFVRSKAAHQLRVGKSLTVGIVVLDIANPFFAEMVRGAERVLRDKGYVLMVCSSDESTDLERQYLRVLEEYRVDGLLITPAERSLEGLAVLAARGIPTVLLDRHGETNSLCSATVDDVRGGELAAGHLFDLGHETIAFVNGPSSIRQCADRREGAKRALRRARRRGAATLREITVAALAVDQGEKAVAALLRRRRGRPRSCAPTTCSRSGVLRGLAANGIAVPEEMAVVGYDDVTFASMLSPPSPRSGSPSTSSGQPRLSCCSKRPWAPSTSTGRSDSSRSSS